MGIDGSGNVVAICPQCGAVLPTDGLLVVLACWPVLTPYKKAGQTTRIERYAHGLGRKR
jgi:hypothetical protein